MRNLWNTRGVYDQLTSENHQLTAQLRDARHANQQTQSQLAELARSLGVLLNDVEGPDQLYLSLSLVDVSHTQALQTEADTSRNLLKHPSHQIPTLQDEAMQASQTAMQTSMTMARLREILSERNREHDEACAELSRLQAIHRQQLEESARARAGAEARALELQTCQLQLQVNLPFCR